MSSEQNKSIVRRIGEAFNSGNLAAYDELVERDFMDHDLTPGQPPGLEGLKNFLGMLRKAFPDAHITSDFLLEEGDMVVERQTFTDTHRGELRASLPPARKSHTLG